MLDVFCESQLKRLEFNEGPLWTFVNPATSLIVSPAFAEREQAEAWRAPYLEQREAKRQAAEEAAQKEEVKRG